MFQKMWDNLLTPDGRRAYAFLALLLGAVVMTGFAAVGVYLVRKEAGLSFWLAIAAHVQVLLVLGVFGAQFVKRSWEAGRDGIKVTDGDVTP